MKRLLSVPEMGIALATLGALLVFQLANPVFLSSANLITLLRACAYTGIIAVGMALCLMSGVLDLSVGATAGLASVVAALLMTKGGWQPLPAFGMGLVTGFVVGFVNGVVITRLQVNPFIATIAMSFVLRGIANSLCQGFSVYPLPEGITELGNLRLGGLSPAFGVLLVVLLGTGWLLFRTVFGLEIRATGSDRESARSTEVNVDWVNIRVLSIVGGLAALSGLLLTAALNAGTPTLGGGWELNIITACAIGGISLSGYEGSMPGLFLGLVFLQVIQNGLVMVGVSAYLQPVAVGLILLGSMILDSRRRRYLNLEKI